MNFVGVLMEDKNTDIKTYKGKRGLRKRPEYYKDAQSLKLDLDELLTLKRGTRYRGAKIRLLAGKYKVDESTIREWLRDYVSYGLLGLASGKRTDQGKFRLPKNTVILIISLFRRYPEKSSRQITRIINEVYPETAMRRSGAKQGKKISLATVTRMRKVFIVQKAKEEFELRRQHPDDKISSFSLEGF